jgi:hypothetical protein
LTSHQSSYGQSCFGAIRSTTSRVAIAVLTLSFPLALAGLAQDEAATTKKKPPEGAQQKTESKSDIVVSGHLSRDSAMPDQTVRFFIVLENHSDAPLRNIGLEHLDAAGFRLVRRCWSHDAQDSACISAGEPPPAMSPACKPQDDKICDELPPHEALTVWGDLLHAGTAPSQQAFAVIRWNLNGFDSRGIAPLGSLESLGWIRGYWLKVTQDWNLGIPVFLAVFSGLFAYWQHRRDQKEETAQKARDKKDEDARQKKEDAAKIEEAARKAKAKADQVEIEQVGRTWHMMLPEIHRLALEHYMPIASTAQGVVQFVRKCADPQGQKTENFQTAFCYTLRFHWRRLRMKRAGASWYFKNRTAEDLIVELVQKHQGNLRINQAAGREAFDVLLPLLNPESTITETVQQLAGIQGSPKTFMEEYFHWVCTPDAQTDALILSAVAKILEYETNRPYLYWYKEIQPLVLTTDELGVVRGVAAQPFSGKTDMAQRVDDYLNECKEGTKIG